MIVKYKNIDIEIRGKLPVDFSIDTDITVRIAKQIIDHATLAEIVIAPD